MKISFLAPLVCFAGLALNASAVSVSLTPSVIGNNYSGFLTLQINGLTNGEMVAVQKFMDVNANGTIDANDLLIQSFRVTDGVMPIIAGVTNINVPGDTDSVGGSITTRLSMQKVDSDHIVGRYVIKLVSPVQRFTPVATTLTITNETASQGFSGVVTCNGTNVPNAVLIVLEQAGDGANFAAGVTADSSGAYSLKAQPGTYMLAALKPGYVGNFGSAPVISLGGGDNVVTNITLTPATRSISGTLQDAGNTSKTLPGIFMFAQSQDGYAAIGSSDTNGNFTISATAGGWMLDPNSHDLAAKGYLGLSQKIPVDTTVSDVFGVNIGFTKGTAVIYGSIKDNLANPIAGVRLSGQNDVNSFQTESITDENGNYSCAVSGGTWGAYVDSSSLAGVVLSQGLGNTNVNDGQALRQDFVALPASHQIVGVLTGENGVPLANIGVYANAQIGGVWFNSYVQTGPGGMYSFNVANGDWFVGVDCDGLNQIGYQCGSDRMVSISNNSTVVNIQVQPCGPVKVSTANLLNGSINNSYFAHLDASGCNQPFTWTLAPNSGPLPPGLTLSSDGNISGNAIQVGAFTFTVRVTDSTQSSAEQQLSIQIVGQPLWVASSTLPTPVKGVGYSYQFQANGGIPPYVWTLASFSPPLPTGLALGTNGLLSGVPSSSAPFSIGVRVTDSVGALFEQYFAGIYPPTLQFVRRISDRAIQLDLSISPGLNYLLQYSFDLTNWFPLMTTNSSSGSVSVTDNSATNSQRFYRAVTAP